MRKVKPGDPLSIPATTFNAMIDAALAHQQGGPAGGAGGHRAQPKNAGVVLLQNKSGANLDAFALVQVDRPIVLPADNEREFRNRIVLQVKKATDAKLPWAITQEALKIDGIGQGVIAGVTVCQINLTDVTHDFVDSGTALTLPQSAASGPASILWVAGGVKTATATGTQWAVIRLGGGSGSPATRMRVTTAANVNSVALAKILNAAGATTGTDIPVLVTKSTTVGTSFFAEMVTPNTGATFNGAAVLWAEIGAYTAPPAVPVLVRITGNVTKPGHYSGVLVTAATGTINTSDATFTTANVGTNSTSIVLRYILEAGLTTHNLASGFYYAVNTGRTTTGGAAVYDVLGTANDAGTAIYQVKSMTSSTATGWDYVRAHA